MLCVLNDIVPLLAYYYHLSVFLYYCKNIFFFNLIVKLHDQIFQTTSGTYIFNSYLNVQSLFLVLIVVLIVGSMLDAVLTFDLL